MRCFARNGPSTSAGGACQATLCCVGRDGSPWTDQVDQLTGARSPCPRRDEPGPGTRFSYELKEAFRAAMTIGKTGDTECFVAALDLFVTTLCWLEGHGFWERRAAGHPSFVSSSSRPSWNRQDRAGTVRRGRAGNSVRREIAVRRGEIG